MASIATLGVQPFLSPDAFSGEGALSPYGSEVFQLLDDPQEGSAFSRPASQGAGYWESSVVIEGMHCAKVVYDTVGAQTPVPLTLAGLG